MTVAMFALLFVLMDKSDEAQLVKFILRFKTVMFLTAGIAPAAFLGMSVHSCLSAVESGEPHLCIEAAPSSSKYFPISFLSEVVRLVLIYFAFGLLWCCCHRVWGGDEEIVALEKARLDLLSTPRGESSGATPTGTQRAGYQRLGGDEAAPPTGPGAAKTSAQLAGHPDSASKPSPRLHTLQSMENVRDEHRSRSAIRRSPDAF